MHLGSKECPVLTGSGLVLRLAALTDAEAWLAGEDDEQRRWFGFSHASTLADATDAIRRWQLSWQIDGPVRHWAIRGSDSSALSGGIELRDGGGDRWDVSYVIFPSSRGNGLAAIAIALAGRHSITA